MVVFAQSVAVDIAPYLHVGYSAAGPTLVIAFTGITGFVLLVACLTIWRKDILSVLRRVGVLAGEANSPTRPSRSRRHTRGPP